MAEQGSSTKQLEQRLGFWDLMGSAVGQIIGAGIMSSMPAAIGSTGRSVFIAFIIAALITCVNAIPVIFLCSCVRLRGGNYTRMGLMAGKPFAGISVVTSMLGQFGLAIYGLSLASYLRPLFGWPESTEKWIGLGVLTLFFALNLLGIDAFAKIQNTMVIVLIASLVMFGAMGIGKVHWDTYFVEDGYFMISGVLGVCQAGGLLQGATAGATAIVSFSAEAKNPVRDIPLVIIVSTLFVACLYAVLAFVAAGILPVPEVGNSLVNVANHILPRPLYYVFIIGGAGGALATTLNNSLASSTKPIMAMCDDGWLPQSFATLTKSKVPFKILTLFYLIAAVFTVSGLSIRILTNMSAVLNGFTTFVLALRTAWLPKILPEQWAKSKFHVSNGVLYTLTAVSCFGSLFNTIMNASTISFSLLMINVAFIAVAVTFSMIKGKNVNMSVSYEDA